MVLSKGQDERTIVLGLEVVGVNQKAPTEKSDVVDTLETIVGEKLEVPNEAVITQLTPKR